MEPFQGIMRRADVSCSQGGVALTLGYKYQALSGQRHVPRRGYIF